MTCLACCYWGILVWNVYASCLPQIYHGSSAHDNCDSYTFFKEIFHLDMLHVCKATKLYQLYCPCTRLLCVSWSLLQRCSFALFYPSFSYKGLDAMVNPIGHECLLIQRVPLKTTTCGVFINNSFVYCRKWNDISVLEGRAAGHESKISRHSCISIWHWGGL